MKIRAYGTTAANQPIGPLSIDRREVGPSDVLIDILFCGVCHSDIHQARGDRGNSVFPMVPGHEIIGRVARVGGQVTQHAIGDLVGVGCVVDSCRNCATCGHDHEQFCEKGAAQTYNSTEMDRSTPTYGGYSTQVVVTEHFVLKVPEALDPAGAAPLLCAGITTCSPLRRWDCKKGDRVAVLGLGGLGHMAVQIAAAMGAEVTMLSTSRAKEADAQRLGAKHFALTSDPSTFTKLAGSFDLIIDTVSAEHDVNGCLGLLRSHGVMVLVGAPAKPLPIGAFSLIAGNKVLAGSGIGGMKETQEMLDFCAEHGIVSDVEIIPVQKINEAHERVLRSDVRYRFVIDVASLAAG